MPPTIPEWLDRTLHNPEYQRKMLCTLSEREQSRDLARSASCLHQMNAIRKTSSPNDYHENYQITEAMRTENRRENRYGGLLSFF